MNTGRPSATVVFCLANCIFSSAHASFLSEPITTPTPINNEYCVQTCKSKVTPTPVSPFAPYETNSIMFKKTSGDNNASEINISVRYFFKTSDDPTDKLKLGDFDIFFSYTTRSDFYWVLSDTRFSAPVVSRLQNPAFHFLRENEKPSAQDNGYHWNWYDFAIEHISNGQATDANASKQAIITAYNTGDPNHLMDTISRADAMAAFTLDTDAKMPSINVPLLREDDLRLKLFIHRWDQEAEVYWGPYANSSVNFNYLQIVQAQWRTVLYSDKSGKYKGQFNAEMTMGSMGLATDSWNFMLNLPFKIYNFTFPLSISAHRGPMNNMSDYTRSQNTEAVGLTFTN